MQVIPAKTPRAVQRVYPKRLWTIDNSTNSVYLTFDDGPIPGVTPWVLEQLRQYDAKATFFCIGDNVKKHPELLEQIVREGHAIGNHTLNHLKGSQTTFERYIDNVRAFESVCPYPSSLFRPPYGRITGRQAKKIIELGYTIVMWDVLSFDWDERVSAEKCLANVVDSIEPGSIVVFHDSLKASKNLRETLPAVLEYISSKNWKSEILNV